MSFIRKIKKGNKTYLAEVENVRVDGKVKQRHIRYVGKEVDGQTIISTSTSDIQIDQVKLSGPLVALNHIAKEIRLSEVLGKNGDEILSLVYAHCLDYKSINQMSNWFERTDLNMILDLENLTEARLLDALDSLESQDATELQRKIFENVKSKYDIDSKGIVYDVTNTYLYGKKCPLGKLGKDKEGVKGRPLIQIGLGVTQKEGIPVFHKTYDGNIHDARTLSDSLTSFESYKIKKGLIVFDRGISSKSNQKAIFSLGWKVLCGLPLNVKLKKMLREILAKEEFCKFKNRVKLNKTIFYAVSCPYSIDDVKGTVTFCFNEQLKKDIKESRYDEITNAQHLISEGKKIKPQLEKYFGSDGRLLTSKLTIDEEFDGFSCIFTTEKISKEKLVKVYFDKDLVEKAFQSLKGVIKVRPIRHWLYNRVIAHIFVCYLAYLLLSLLNFRLQKIKISPVSALQELETLYKVYLSDSKRNLQFSRTIALTKKQEQILKCIDKKLLTQCSV